MPTDLPIDSEDSGRVLRHAFVAAKFKPGTHEWQKYAAEVPRIAERRRAMIAVLNGPKNGGIALQDTAGPDFGVNPRTVRRDMERVARTLKYSGNAVFKQLQSNFLSSEESRRAITTAVQEYKPPLHGKEPLISDTSAALVVTVHEMRSKVAPVSRRAAARDFRNIVHATGAEMAKVAVSDQERTQANALVDAKVDRRTIRSAQARGWALMEPGRMPSDAPRSMFVLYKVFVDIAQVLQAQQFVDTACSGLQSCVRVCDARSLRRSTPGNFGSHQPEA
jgi:hypothetical protein